MIVAGTSATTWRAATTAALVGSVPEAVLYALTDAVAATFQDVALMFTFILVMSAVVWLTMRRANHGFDQDAALEQAAGA